MKGFIVAGTSSGSGKTTVSLGLMAALVKRGLKVAPFKVGPDFIDPGHHNRITGRVSRNLDGWMLSKAYNRDCFGRHTAGADVAVVEGVMGLFDGYDGKSEAGSTAQMAKWLGLPVLLVVNAKSMARSAAALIQGFENFDRDLSLAGVLFNNLGSSRHLDYLREALADSVRTPCMGGILRDPALEIPERHLGLVTDQDHSLSTENRKRLAMMIESSMDVDLLLKTLPTVETKPVSRPEQPYKKTRTVRIGVARDKAFCFYYADNLDLLEEKGAELVFFSPMSAHALPSGIDGLYLGGGYPELYAKRLAENTPLLNQIQKHSRRGMPIYGECGGMMYLCRRIIDMEGKGYPMTGCLPFSTRMLTRLRSLGYREVRLLENSLIGRAGNVIRGHEFHYSELTDRKTDIDTTYAVTARNGKDLFQEGFRRENTLGSYMHLHFGSLPGAAAVFVESCLKYRQEKE